MYRFVLKGSGMQPVRVRSAVNRSVSRMSLPARSKSALDPMIEDDISETESGKMFLHQIFFVISGDFNYRFMIVDNYHRNINNYYLGDIKEQL